MLSVKCMLNVVNAFIKINVLEVSDNLSYVERLAEAVKILNYDEQAFAVFSQMFNNKNVCMVMINWIDARF